MIELNTQAVEASITVGRERLGGRDMIVVSIEPGEGDRRSPGQICLAPEDLPDLFEMLTGELLAMGMVR